MNRLTRTLTLTAAALGLAATTAAATPPEAAPIQHDAMRAPMHAHAVEDPAMQAHMAGFGIDRGEMHRRHADGPDHGQMHDALHGRMTAAGHQAHHER